MKPDMADENGRFLPACMRGGGERGNGSHVTLHDLRYITALLSELVIYGTAAQLFELDFQSWSPGVGKLLGVESILSREVWVWCWLDLTLLEPACIHSFIPSRDGRFGESRYSTG